MNTVRTSWGRQRNILEISGYRMYVFRRLKLVEQNDSLMSIVSVLSTEWGIYMFLFKCEHVYQWSNKVFPTWKWKVASPSYQEFICSDKQQSVIWPYGSHHHKNWGMNDALSVAGKNGAWKHFFHLLCCRAWKRRTSRKLSPTLSKQIKTWYHRVKRYPSYIWIESRF